ncbi:galactokinase-like [Coccinella septempunctata]|uniref:galactokinase-like n=1 Tax=Coccinella septempunctata TaxID=41139 RepID=UPI001D05F14F|nr:galactokinase-like [Coccinella septempunctata]
MVENIPSLEEMIQSATELFRKTYKVEPSVIVQAPGRVNLIGEHIDYNDGFVLPMALPLRTVLVGKPICGFEASMVSMASEADSGTHPYNFNISKEALQVSEPKWANYVKGVLANYKGGSFPAFQVAIVNSVPIGGGLSSSASLEVATYLFLDAISGEKIKVSKVEKALACQKAEHDFAGMPCGIMDQFISLLAEDSNALLIDCRDMTYFSVPFDDPNIVILITNSNVKHSLSGSEYPTRRRQCQEAATLLGKRSLRECTIEDVKKLSALGASEEHIKRARHGVSEIIRTEQAAKLFAERRYEEVGKLMVESHNSLRDDYDVSCPELNQLVELAMKVEGVMGARMTGGGFGGCTVTMVKAFAVDKVIEMIKTNYHLNPKFFICKPSQGASIIKAII